MLAMIPALGAVELVLQVYFSQQAPSIEAWHTLTAPVAGMKQEGDLVVVAPGWADPLARHALGDELMPLRDAARGDESRYAAAIEISILGQRVDGLSSWREEVAQTHGPFLLRRLINPTPAEVVFDFVDHLRPPFVDVRGTDPEVRCGWNPNAPPGVSGPFGHPVFSRERFECPGGAFFHVGVTVIADEAFQPHRCLWSQPLKQGELVTRFQGVPLGEVIRGHGGIYWIVERERSGAPVTLTVRVNGETIGSTTHNDGDGWAPFEFALGRHSGAAEAEVEFAVSTPNWVQRHYCFEADTRIRHQASGSGYRR